MSQIVSQSNSVQARLLLPNDIWPSSIQDVLMNFGEIDDGERAALIALLMSTHSTVSRLARTCFVNSDSEDSADRLTEQYIRFMILLAEEQPHPTGGQLSTMSPSPFIEKLWSLHLLETHSYAQMCANIIPGGAVIHHTSLKSQPLGRLARIQLAMSAYRKHFRSAPPQSIWNTPPTVCNTVQNDHPSSENGLTAVREDEQPGSGVGRHKRPREATVLSPPERQAGQDEHDHLMDVEFYWTELTFGRTPLSHGTRTCKTLSIFVKTLTGATPEFVVSRRMDIAAFKELVEGNTGIPMDQQRLIYAGRMLEDSNIFGDMALESGTTLHLVLRPRGC